MTARKQLTAEQQAAQAARDRLTAALQNLTERDLRPPCAGDDRFIADDAATLTEAAALCSQCPIRRQCADAGQYEVAGVWAGLIRGQAHGAQGRRRSATITTTQPSEATA